MAAQQQSLFDTEAPAWEVDARSQQLVATVVFAEQPVGQFDYAVPAELADRRQPLVVEAGRRVRVPSDLKVGDPGFGPRGAAFATACATLPVDG